MNSYPAPPNSPLRGRPPIRQPQPHQALPRFVRDPHFHPDLQGPDSHDTSLDFEISHRSLRYPFVGRPVHQRPGIPSQFCTQTSNGVELYADSSINPPGQLSHSRIEVLDDEPTLLGTDLGPNVSDAHVRQTFAPPTTTVPLPPVPGFSSSTQQIPASSQPQLRPESVAALSESTQAPPATPIRSTTPPPCNTGAGSVHTFVRPDCATDHAIQLTRACLGVAQTMHHHLYPCQSWIEHVDSAAQAPTRW
ncbi:hypothetical protein B0H13DRAFT_2320749 [Mycena leptocephala]|nr:hypothetical protein B0H13DRAFT_2320749 [Mycena leptocephala]